MSNVGHAPEQRAAGFGRAIPEQSQARARAWPALGTAFFQRLIEHGSCSVLVIETLSHEQTIVYASPAVEELTGYAPAELVGLDWRRVLAPVRARSRADALGCTLRSRLITHQNFTVRHRDGTELHLDVKLSPFETDTAFITHQIAVLNDLTAEHRARAALEHRAYHDPLTGLANRYLLCDRFEHAAAHARRCGEGLTIVLLDLDGFKLVNDRHGHGAGDAMLIGIGSVLERIVRGEDTAARLGGDEFVLLLVDAESRQSTRTVIARIQGALQQPLSLCAPSFGVSCCTGTACFPDDGVTLESLLQTADQALYAEKARRNLVHC